MRLRNDLQNYGQTSILLHWLMAVFLIGLFILGEYMVDLDYYDPWYQKAPDLHRSTGVIVALMLIIRLAWRLSNPQPEPIGKPWEQRMAAWAHRLFYVLIAAISISGYLITTADGQAVHVFNWFEIPSTFYGFDNQEDIAGEVHQWLTYILIAMVVLHTLAALQHHFFHRDDSLRRIIDLRNNPTNPNNPTQSKE
jgi:cytochrome b561